MTVIVFACSKGGPGKTTCAILLATELAAQSQCVSILDADTNNHISIWAKNGGCDGVEVVGNLNEDTILDAIEVARQRSSFVIVDLEGSKNMCVSYAISRADIIIIPAKPSTLDIHEAAKTVRLIKQQEKAFGRTIPFRLVLTQTSAAIRSRGIGEIEADIKQNNIPRLDVELIARDPFASLIKHGGGLRTMLACAPTRQARTSIEKAIVNAEAFALEVIASIKTSKEALLLRGDV